MTSSIHSISPLRQRMLDDMRMRKLEPKTQSGYIRAVRRLAAFLKRSPDTATVEDLRNFQLHLVDQGTSPITLNERNDHRLEVFLRCHARAQRSDGQDEPGAGAAKAPGGAQPRGGCAPDRRSPQPQAPSGDVGGLWRWLTRERDRLAQGQ